MPDPTATKYAAYLAIHRTAGTTPRSFEDWRGEYERARYVTAQDVDAAVKSWSPPTEAQQEAGNYQKPTINWNGLRIKIENPRGTKRRPEWKPLAHHYGYIARTEDRDGDAVDCYVGPHQESEIVFVVDQEHPGGRFDEHKVCLAFRNAAEARKGYLDNYQDGWHCGPITAMTIEQFKAWLERGDTKTRVAEQVSRYAAKSPAPDPDLAADDLDQLAEQLLIDRYARKHLKSSAGQQSLHFESAAPTGKKAWTAEDEKKHPRAPDGEWAAKGEESKPAPKPKAPAEPDKRLQDHVANLHDAMQERLGAGKQFLARHADKPLWIASGDHIRLADDRATLEHTDPEGRWVRADLAQLDHWADKAGVQPFTGPEGILTSKEKPDGSESPNKPAEQSDQIRDLDASTAKPGKTDPQPAATPALKAEDDRPLDPGGRAGSGDSESLGGSSKAIEQMNATEFAAFINSQPNNKFIGSHQENWGNTRRGQGKRVGGQVRGGMSDAPQGIKTYTDAFAGLPDQENAIEIKSSPAHYHPDYLRARAAGLSHDDAMVWTYERHGEVEPGTTHGRVVTGDRPEQQPTEEPDELLRTDDQDGRSGVLPNDPKQSDRGETGAPAPDRKGEGGTGRPGGVGEDDPPAGVGEQPSTLPDAGHGSQALGEDSPAADSGDSDEPTEDEAQPEGPAGPDPELTPRQNAERATARQLDDEYTYARKSAIPNAGEDVLDSARHKRNAWQNLDRAEQDGTAEELVTRDKLLKNEPHNLMVHVTRNPLTVLAMHFALRSFPATPVTKWDREVDPKQNRSDYLDAYRVVKEAAERLAASEPDPRKAMQALGKVASDHIGKLRGQGARAQFNNTANSMVSMANSLKGYGAKRSYKQLDEFARAFKDQYGLEAASTTAEELNDRLADHVGDVVEGMSVNATFGKKQAGRPREFDPAEMYVKHAERTGGKPIPEQSAAENLDHMTGEMGFRAVQWGNSVSDDERVHHAQKAFEAFLDLADVLGLPVKAVSGEGQLALAIGARGHGKALAHYEATQRVINLTRKNGVGSLAHEWGHFFDNWQDGFGKGFWSERQGGTGEMAQARDQWDKALKTSGYLRRLTEALQQAVNERRMSAQHATNYWGSSREVFARTFERYVQRKMERAGRRNTYLAGIETKAYKQGGYWPTDEEVDAMTPAFDGIFDAYRKSKYGPDVDKSTILASNDALRRFSRELYAAWYDRTNR